MMEAATLPAEGYAAQRARLQHYFDRTARDAWEQLTSDAPVSRIRATVRAGRETMRTTILDWLPRDFARRRLLDAGCGTGTLAVEAARRGAQVLAVDVAAGLVDVARARALDHPAGDAIDWRVGDMTDPALGEFDHVVAMDSLIHYPLEAIIAALGRLAPRTRRSIIFTFAPRTPALAAMHTVGRLFPRSDRAPGIEPVAEAKLVRAVGALPGWRTQRTLRVSQGFYTSQALELVRRG